MSSDPQHAAMEVDRKERAGKTFLEVWAEKIYPAIATDYAAMVDKSPTREVDKKEKKAKKAAEKADKKAKKRAKRDGEEECEEECEEEGGEAGDQEGMAASARSDNQGRLLDIATTVF